MFSHLAVTTFSKRGYDVYGERFVESFLVHWPIPLVVFHESQECPVVHERLIWLNLDECPDRAAFIKRNSTPEKVGDWTNPNMQSIRFCHKVFAITDPRIPDSNWRIWLDADVETVAPVTTQALDAMCPPDKRLSFLGRLDKTWGKEPHAECGFVGYRTGDENVRRMLEHMRHTYTSDYLYQMGHCNWHDGAVFEAAKDAYVPEDYWHNLSPGLCGLHVWPHTVLGKYLVHHKGIQRKQKAYGEHA